MSINIVPVPNTPHYDKLLASFKPEHHDKLRLYTAEELYYVLRIMQHKPSYNALGDIKNGDVFVLVLQQKIKGYLKGTGKPIYPSAWSKLGRRYTEDFMQFLATTIDIEQVTKDLREHFRKVG
jgi:hypothetical protein